MLSVCGLVFWCQKGTVFKASNMGFSELRQSKFSIFLLNFRYLPGPHGWP